MGGVLGIMTGAVTAPAFRVLLDHQGGAAADPADADRYFAMLFIVGFALVMLAAVALFAFISRGAGNNRPGLWYLIIGFLIAFGANTLFS